jgi:hypothetical protein
VCKCVLNYCHRVATQLHSTNISYHHISYHIISYHHISYHIIISYISSYNIISYIIISYHHHIISSYHIISYICNKNQQNAHFLINDFIQLYCLRPVSNIQVFILRKTCTCSLMLFLSCARISSLVVVRLCLISRIQQSAVLFRLVYCYA